MKYIIKRKKHFIKVEDAGPNWSPYLSVIDKNSATIFNTKEEAEKVVSDIKRDKNYKQMSLLFGEPVIVEVKK